MEQARAAYRTNKRASCKQTPLPRGLKMDDNLEFTDDEIREELGKLGYPNVPESRLAEFKKGVRIEGKTRSPLEESPLERQYCQWRTGKENQGRPESPKDVHHIPRKPDAKFSMYEPEADLSQYSLRDDVSETDSERRMVKRKVLRKDKDGSKHVDESMTESDFGSIQDINERLRELGIIDRVDFFSKRRPQSSRSEPPYRLSPDDPRPSSVILRKPEHPHTRNIKKTDPVARYQQFRQSWSAQRAPGEKNHKNLRWNVREQMLAQDVVYEKKPHRVFVPNKYTVPSDKKRQSLRWQIRTDMAQGQLPHHGFYAEY
ncbi:HYLS1-like protein [Mya arenaria]|uniref:HYLS1-like protein n=1 Tax=Mya arenaria TaxID=6604 RepID=A0ABY7FAK8_MYAAR|nr:HYLS1-like protein [Mya arenaria]